jgi:hypothetical protein
MSRLLKSVRPSIPIAHVSPFLPSQSLSRNITLRYTRTCVRPPLLVVPRACVALQGGFGNVRHYANPPEGGMPRGFSAFNLGQQPQKGDALKEYVRVFLLTFCSRSYGYHDCRAWI